ncbi:sensor histidine kinase [Marinitenerispora sediminis]|uniref:sensor histidine kinase n=1 Tax=Marinitenerispora sediminis TaxID=1931232 RepID=UPI0013142D9C|nr:histidine kinase [Marinitenerispora sediminis]
MDVRTDTDGALPEAGPSPLGGRLDRLLTRVGIAGEFARDCALAGVVALCSAAILVPLPRIAEAEGFLLTPLSVTAIGVLAAAQSLLLAIRRTNPALCLVLVALTQIALVTAVPTGLSFRGLAPFIAAYTCGTRLAGPPMLRFVAAVAVVEGIVAGAAASTLTGLIAPEQPAEVAGSPLGDGPLALWTLQFVASVLTYLPAALIGGHMATRRRYVELVKVSAAERVRAQQDRADSAIRAERARMARELHDIAAHHLSGMVVQAAAVERLIDRDPRAAKEATAWIRGQGKETLDNLRLVVGALRDPADGAAANGTVGRGGRDLGGDGAPVPGLAVLDRLVQTERDLGADVEAECEGERYELAPVADVAFYRVAQEALSNARDHAPGARVRVGVRYRESAVALEVTNEPRPGSRPAGPGAHGPRASGAPRGHGLIGMRERAQLIGAAFDAGPTESGGWRVSLELPVDQDTKAAGSLTAETGGAA